jgi:PAS domain S-box-containing protein
MRPAYPPTLDFGRLAPVLLALAVGGVLSAGLFGIVRAREREQIQREFERNAHEVEVPLRTRIDGGLDVLDSLGRFYASSSAVDADEFARFTATAFVSRPGLRALAWAPREEGSFPIRFVAPSAEQRALAELRLGSDPDSRAALEAARDAAAPVAAPPPSLGAGSESLGYLVLLPIYDTDPPPRERAERRRHLAGFVLGALSLPEIMQASLADVDGSQIAFRLVEVNAAGQVLRQLHPPDGREAFGGWSGPLPRPFWSTSIERAGRSWRVEAMPAEGYLTTHRQWQGWSVLLGGALFTLLLAAYLRNLSLRTARVEAVVVRRTEELKEAKEAAEDSARRTRLIIDTAYDAFVAMDAAGSITDWNHQAELTFGWRREEILGRTVADTIVPPQHREAHWRGLRHFLASGEGPVLGRRIELTALHRDGHEFQVEITIASVPLGGSHLFTAFVHDITERKQAEAELRAAKDQAQAATQAKSEFLANMSHEIRTPLNGIIGMTELALDTELTAEQHDYLSLVKSSADHLLSVINDVLDFSKIEAGRLELERLEFDLRDVLEDTVATLAARAHDQGLELLDDIAVDVPTTLVGDFHRLRQVVVNLIGNAIKFTERGEVVLRVERAPAPEPGAVDTAAEWLHFSVRDTGIGISPEQQTRLFRAFSQADTSTTRKYGGTGLGLAISARIVGQMGGRIWLESEKDCGSTFHFTARFERAPGAEARRAERAELRGLRVLVVDDNATNRRILEGMLTSWGMRPTLADGAPSALALLAGACEAGEPFAVVLLDAMMPGMDGFTLAERIQQGSGAAAGATLMMLSSAARREDAERCRALGVAACLGKPIRQSTLLDALLTALAPGARDTARPGIAPEAAPQPGRESLCVLLAEDNAINQRLAVSLLEKRGHRVVVAGNGREALAALERERFDVVLMDVQMPELDGFEATALIRAREQQSGGHLPIIAMTAHAMKGDRERCLAAGMDGYIAKPLDAEELFLALRGVVAPGVDGAVPEAPTGAAFDRRAALERIGDVELFGKLVELFLDECPKRMGEISQGIRAHDGRAVERAAHNLKGAAAVFSAEAACLAAESLEAVGRERSWSDAERALHALEDAVARLRLALRESEPGPPS